MAGAIQPRVNKAIQDRLRANAALLELLQEAGAKVTPSEGLPLWWWLAPPSAEPPYIVFGGRDQQSTVTPNRCGEAGDGSIDYVIELITEGLSPAGGLDIIDAVADLLDGYNVAVEGVQVDFLRIGDVCYPDYAISETGRTHTGLIYRVLVRP